MIRMNLQQRLPQRTYCIYKKCIIVSKSTVVFFLECISHLKLKWLQFVVIIVFLSAYEWWTKGKECPTTSVPETEKKQIVTHARLATSFSKQKWALPQNGWKYLTTGPLICIIWFRGMDISLSPPFSLKIVTADFFVWFWNCVPLVQALRALWAFLYNQN